MPINDLKKIAVSGIQADRKIATSATNPNGCAAKNFVNSIDNTAKSNNVGDWQVWGAWRSLEQLVFPNGATDQPRNPSANELNAITQHWGVQPRVLVELGNNIKSQFTKNPCTVPKK